eukprot:TRINITY_DN5027_c3_g1_i1.p1 TRINITY_DN5027_c3_g1~~TRINITY_DN5027_c3_g1_i1.p1  ORF type:complete len:1709 (+),score=558.24 TRINITY_DN5027_c3_g1_i1:61-5127(+)
MRPRWACALLLPAAGVGAAPSPAPSGVPSPAPSGAPSAAPSTAPSAPPGPSAAPAAAPTAPPGPSAAPVAAPTAPPSVSPTTAPTTAPSAVPSAAPAPPGIPPSAPPTAAPSGAPAPPGANASAPSTAPSAAPSASPAAAPPPSGSPSAAPSNATNGTGAGAPTAPPSLQPSRVPSAAPSTGGGSPSGSPSSAPSAPPTQDPSQPPSAAPSGTPTASPRPPPTAAPTVSPSWSPWASAPSASPQSSAPSAAPSAPPSTSGPSAAPLTAAPSAAPTTPPTLQPSAAPSAPPTAQPSTPPPSAAPSQAPSNYSGEVTRMECVSTNGSCAWLDVCRDKAHVFHHGADASDAPPYNVMAMASCVTVGALLRFLSLRFAALRKVPFTIAVFLIGMIFGFIAAAGDEEDNVLSNYDDLTDVDPHLIFFVFLPVLIFESAFVADTYVFKKVFWHCLLLAGPGLVLSTVLTAVVVKYAFWEYNWSWITSLLFGTICSATDPVAVVALLKDLGVGEEIATLIEGESLLNDGIAIVIFTVLKGSVPSGTLQQSGGEVFGELCQVAIGGPLIGLAMALLAEQVLERVFNDPLIEVTLTLSVAYMTFFIAEGMLHVSGVLALVVLGLYLSSHCQAFSPEVEHLLHGFWGILSFVANILIFGLAGLIIAEKGFRELKGIDALYLLIVFILVNVVRAVVVALAMPVMGLLHYKVDRPHGYLLIWSGLRGAVGLALALIVENDVDIECSQKGLGAHFIFYVGGIVLLTLCVNGVTTGALVKRLSLDHIPLDRRKAMNDAVQAVRATQEHELLELSSQSVMAAANWKVVHKNAIEGIADPYSGGRSGDDLESTFKAIDAWEEGRGVYFKQVIASLQEQQHSGTLSPTCCRRLTDMIQMAKDNDPKDKLLTADRLDHYYQFGVVDRLQLCLAGPCRESRKEELEIQRWNSAFEITIAFVKAHEHVARTMGAEPNVEREVALRIRDHCRKTRTECLASLGEHQHQRPRVAVAIMTQQASRGILNKAAATVRELVSCGKLGAAEGQVLLKVIEGEMERVRLSAPRELAEPSVDDVVQRVPWACIDPGAAHKLMQRGGLRSFSKGAQILPRSADETAILITGVVHAYVRGSVVYRGPGYAVGLLKAVSGDCSVGWVFSADTNGRALYISNDELGGILRQSPRALEAAWSTAGSDTALVLLSMQHPYSEWPVRRLRTECANGRFLPVPEEDSQRLVIPRGYRNLLLHGQCEWVDRSTVVDEDPDSAERHAALPVCLLPEQFDVVTAQEGTRVFSVRDASSSHEKARRNWARVAERLSLIHTMQLLLCGPETLRTAKGAVVRAMIEGLFGAGKSLDKITGGFGINSSFARICPSPSGSPRGRFGDIGGGVRVLGGGRRRSKAPGLSEPLLPPAASPAAPPPEEEPPGEERYIPPPPPRDPRLHSKVLSPPLGARATSPELAAAQELEAAAAALRNLAASQTGPQQHSRRESGAEGQGQLERWEREQRERADREEQMRVSDQLRVSLLQAVAEREHAEEQLLHELEDREKGSAARRRTALPLAQPRTLPRAPPPAPPALRPQQEPLAGCERNFSPVRRPQPNPLSSASDSGTVELRELGGAPRPPAPYDADAEWSTGAASASWAPQGRRRAGTSSCGGGARRGFRRPPLCRLRCGAAARRLLDHWGVWQAVARTALKQRAGLGVVTDVCVP